MIYTVTFNPAVDYVVGLDGELRLGDINRNCRESCQYGGKGINVSNVLRTLGVDTVALGFVAGFTGEGLEKGLQEMGLVTDFVHLPEGLTRINVKIHAGVETAINGIGPTISLDDMTCFFAKLDRLQDGDTLVLSGSVPASLGADIYANIMAYVQDKAVRVVVDATGELLWKALPYKPFLVKPNDEELGELFGTVSVTDGQILEQAKKLQEMGARNVLVSMAGNGALLLDEMGNHHRIGCPAGEVINSVGAGDSMVAGFLAGYQMTEDYTYALKLGTAAGSATAFSLALGSKQKIMELLATL